MTRHAVKVVDTVERCTDVRSVRFERPAGYSFAAGQYLLLTLETANGPETKPFTHSSAPHDPHLEVTTRLSGSPFKDALEHLSEGDELSFAGPAGRFSVPQHEDQVAFLVGGVGITPAISMLRDWDARGSAPGRVVLCYGNRTASCIPFAEEIDTLGIPGFESVHVLEDAPDEWTGNTGFITAEVVREAVGLEEGWLFVAAGPPAMVDAMETVLDALRIPGDRRLVERFTER